MRVPVVDAAWTNCSFVDTSVSCVIIGGFGQRMSIPAGSVPRSYGSPGVPAGKPPGGLVMTGGVVVIIIGSPGVVGSLPAPPGIVEPGSPAAGSSPPELLPSPALPPPAE